MALPSRSTDRARGAGLSAFAGRAAVRPILAMEESVDERDLALMGRIRDGCKEAFASLVHRYWTRLVHYSSEILGNRDEAQDIIQETFIRVWVKRKDWMPKGTVNAYLYRIARNLSLNADRDRKGRKRRHLRAEKHSGVTPAPDPHLELQAASVRGEVRKAIDGLPPRQREVFVLSRFHGLTHREVAETMGISERTVANQMTSALRTLRGALQHLLKP